jgi:hypothetical protein
MCCFRARRSQPTRALICPKQGERDRLGRIQAASRRLAPDLKPVRLSVIYRGIGNVFGGMPNAPDEDVRAPRLN